MSQRVIEDVSVGDEMPPMVKNASRAQLFLFSAATNNPHRIHYDREYAAVEGHPDVLVHGPLQGAWLSQFVADWAGPERAAARDVVAESRPRFPRTRPHLQRQGYRQSMATKSRSKSGKRTTRARC